MTFEKESFVGVSFVRHVKMLPSRANVTNKCQWLSHMCAYFHPSPFRYSTIERSFSPHSSYFQKTRKLTVKMSFFSSLPEKQTRSEKININKINRENCIVKNVNEIGKFIRLITPTSDPVVRLATKNRIVSKISSLFCLPLVSFSRLKYTTVDATTEEKLNRGVFL